MADEEDSTNIPAEASASRPSVSDAPSRTPSRNRMTEDHAVGSLSIMVLHLPDPYEHLYIQLDVTRNLREFTVFKKLPLELRLEIWRLSFPPRLVRLHPRLLEDDRPKPRTQDPLPVTLRVNQESRREARRHYHFLKCPRYTSSTQHPRSSRPPYPRHICINPRVDSVYVSYIEMMVYRHKVGDYITALVSQNILCFHAIEQLEVRDVCALSTARGGMKYMVHIDSKRTGTLLLFPGLKHICITAYKMFNCRLQNAAAAEKFKEDITGRFKKYRWMFLKSNVPEVIARQWQPLRAGSF